MPSVTAAIVNWNSGDDLARIVQELAAQVDVDVSIIVVDNGSIDDSVQRALATGVTFHLEAAGRNLGYTGGNALAGQLAGPEADLFIVNPDVSLHDPRTVATLVETLATDGTLAAVAPVLVSGSGIAAYRGVVLDLDRAKVEQTGCNSAVPEERSAVALDWVSGAAWLIRAEAREQAGLFDDRFFLYFEEVEWCIRVRALGWRVALCRSAQVAHNESASFRGSGVRYYYYWRNLYLLCKLHSTAPLRWRWYFAGNLLRSLFAASRMRAGGRRMSVLGVVDALRGRYGPAPHQVTVEL